MAGVSGYCSAESMRKFCEQSRLASGSRHMFRIFTLPVAVRRCWVVERQHLQLPEFVLRSQLDCWSPTDVSKFQRVDSSCQRIVWKCQMCQWTIGLVTGVCKDTESFGGWIVPTTACTILDTSCTTFWLKSEIESNPNLAAAGAQPLKLYHSVEPCLPAKLRFSLWDRVSEVNHNIAACRYL